MSIVRLKGDEKKSERAVFVRKPKRQPASDASRYRSSAPKMRLVVDLIRANAFRSAPWRTPMSSASTWSV